MTPTLLLWDVDGTILSNRGIGKMGMNAAFEEVFGVSGAFDGIETAGGLDLHFFRRAFDKTGVSEDRLDEVLEVYYRKLRELLEVRPSRLMDNIVEILDETQRRPHLYNAVGTGNLEPAGRIKLDEFGLNGYFPVGGFCDEACERYQMLQKGIEKAERHYGVTFAPDRVIVIGDTTKDINAARQLGARVIAVATGGHSYEELEAAQPDLLLENLTDSERFFAFCEGTL